MLITNSLTVTRFKRVYVFRCRFLSGLHSLVATDVECLRQRGQRAGLPLSKKEFGKLKTKGD